MNKDEIEYEEVYNEPTKFFKKLVVANVFLTTFLVGEAAIVAGSVTSHEDAVLAMAGFSVAVLSMIGTAWANIKAHKGYEYETATISTSRDAKDFSGTRVSGARIKSRRGPEDQGKIVRRSRK